MRIILLFFMLGRALSTAIRKYHFINYYPRHLKSCPNFTRNYRNFNLKALFPEDVASKIHNTFEKIRNDEIELPPLNKSALKKNLYLKSYPNLSKYTRELDLAWARSTFLGCTLVEKDKTLDNIVLHFRGYERGESLCLCFNPRYFPLFPTVSFPFRGVTERSLEYFEHVLSGLTGLRVCKLYTPFPFRKIIAIDLADSTDLENVLYKLYVVADRYNKLLLVDNTDQVVLGSSCCLNKHDVKDNPFVGRKFELPAPTKLIPSPDETFEEFMSHFKGLNGYNVIKAFSSVYEGVDFNFINEICSELQIEPTSYFYKVPDHKLLHELFSKKVKSTFDNEGPYEDITTKIYETYGCLSPSYRLNRLLETSTSLAQDYKERLEKVASQCEKEGNMEKLSETNEKIEGVEDYQNAMEDVRVTRDPKKLENLEDFHDQILRMKDLKAFKMTEKKKKIEEEKEIKVEKKIKKVGKIMSMFLTDNDDSPLMIVGKNARQNEVITTQMRKDGDLWLHAKDCPGSHVLLRNSKNYKYSVQVAADVAAFFSKNKNNKNVEVVVANVEKVRKEPGMQLGAVNVEEYVTVVGEPERGGKFIDNFKAKSQ